MDREMAFREMIECIKDFNNCVVTLEDGEQYSISPATDYVGGEEGYYMSSELGNIMYSYVEEICNDLLSLIEKANVPIEEVTVD
jgi:hypothetical protein